MELCSMASRGCLPGPGFVSRQEPGSCRVLEDLHRSLPFHVSNQESVDPLSFNLRMHQKEEWRSTGGLLDYNHFVKIDSTSKTHELIHFQETHPETMHLGFGIVEQCARHEKFLKLLASGSIEEHDNLLDLSMLHDLLGPQSLYADFSQQPFASSSQPLQDLIYPTTELYFNEPFLDLEKAYRPHDGLPCSCTGDEINDILSVISDFHSSKNTNKSSKQTMLVPYFERRRRARSKTDASKLAAEKVGSLKSNEKVKQKTSQKKKTSTKNIKERDIYSNSYLHTCESLLSIIVDRNHQAKSAIASLKKSGPQLPQLLTQFSATIAGTGIAVVLSVLCRVACSRVPFCASKLLSTGLGLGLVWLSRAVYKLRDTVASIGKSSRTFGEREDEMMKHLGRNLKDIYFRAAALMVVVVLKVA